MGEHGCRRESRATRDAAQRWPARGPILRDLAPRAPYFHNGFAKDLDAVVDFYEDRFKLNLSKQERSDLIAVLLLYAVTMFTGATLLFVVQPMVGKMILPLLGGTPAVWSTCMVFFQAALLGGYAYAHASTAWLSLRGQMLLHLALLALPLAVLPLAVNPALLRGGESNPILDVLVLLSLAVGLPFLVVSATAPLIQKWFTHTGHPAARDPYFLYAASNLGSMLALLGYPTLIEPRLHLRGEGWLTQTRLWSLGYLTLAALIALCMLILWRSAPAELPTELPTDLEDEPDQSATDSRSSRL